MDPPDGAMNWVSLRAVCVHVYLDEWVGEWVCMWCGWVGVVINQMLQLHNYNKDSSYDNVRAVTVKEKSTREALEVTT